MNILIILVIVALVYGVIKITMLPLKILFKILINSGIGLVMLFLFNIVGESFGMYIAINPITVLVVGVLGIPGIAFLMIYTYFLM